MTFVDLDAIGRFLLPRAVLNETVACLQMHGHRGHEGRVLWVGTPAPKKAFRISEAWVPRQRNTAISTSVDAPELLRISKRLDSTKLVLAAQVHSHPREAFHSGEDDDYPICTQQGSLSLVAPRFALDEPVNLREWAVYRLGTSGWTGPIDPREADLLLRVED